MSIIKSEIAARWHCCQADHSSVTLDIANINGLCFPVHFGRHMKGGRLMDCSWWCHCSHKLFCWMIPSLKPLEALCFCIMKWKKREPTILFSLIYFKKNIGLVVLWRCSSTTWIYVLSTPGLEPGSLCFSIKKKKHSQNTHLKSSFCISKNPSRKN